MVILSPSSGDLLASDEELSDATLSPSTEPSSNGSDTASSFLAKRKNKMLSNSVKWEISK